MIDTLALDIPTELVERILMLFGWRGKEDEPLDAESISQRLRHGLEDLSDADRRRDGSYRDSLNGLSLEDAQIADRIASALERRKEVRT